MSPVPSSPAHPTGRCTDRSEVARFAADFGLETLADDDIARVRDVAAAMIGAELASAACLIECQRAARAVVFGYREASALTGMIALLPMNTAGLRELHEARFNAREPSTALIARPGEEPACYYAWGIAAFSKDAARALIRASAALHAQLFWAIPSFTRAATADGLRLMSSFGYRPFGAADPALIMAPAPGAPKALSP